MNAMSAATALIFVSTFAAFGPCKASKTLSSARDNVAYGLKLRGVDKAKRNRKAEETLELVGLAVQANRFPHQMSGGQQQRVAIARALAMEPRLMLFDEPTSALDPELVGEVLESMRRLAQSGMTMIVVTHEMAFARRVATETIFMHKGKIWEQGRSSELFANPQTPELRQFVKADVK